METSDSSTIGVQGTASYTSSTVSVTIQDPGCPSSSNNALIIGWWFDLLYYLL
jgi:hypothetical protein